MNKEEAKQYVADRSKDYDLSNMSVKEKVTLINQLIKELRYSGFVTLIDDRLPYPVQGVSIDDSGMTYLV